MRALFTFLYGFFAELVRLMLVLAATALGAVFFGVEMGTVHPGDLGLMLGFFAFYAAFALVPARNLVAGWLGVLSGHVPRGFTNRADNLGRGLCGLAFAALWLAVLVSTFGQGRRGESTEAITFAFVLLAMLVFGAGLAVPRLWLAARGRQPEPTDRAPALITQAHKRAPLFFYCAFLGIGLGLAAAHAVAALTVDHAPTGSVTTAPATGAVPSGGTPE